MSAQLALLKAGPGVTIQDRGRFGFLRYGVTQSGPMDFAAFALANLAVGNVRDAAALEISTSGAEFEAQGGALDLAFVGPGFDVRLDGRSLPDAVTLRLEPGARLVVRAGTSGSWGYLAIAGRLDLPKILGSLSTHTRSSLGGLQGRSLQAGDVLHVVETRARDAATARVVAPWLEASEAPIRVMLGPQDDYFVPDQIAAFLTRNWRVSGRSDRMAYGLDGEPLTHARGHDIVSDGLAHGAIQVPGSGLPFVLMADRQPTGGYPKIATVIGADLGRMAQIRPGAFVRFQAVDFEEALSARRVMTRHLDTPVATEPLIRTDFSSEFLLSANLISGAV